MAWILTQSTTLPSQVTAAETDNSTPPTGAFVVDTGVAMQAVGNPAGYILNSAVETSSGPDGRSIEKTVYRLTLAPLTLQAAQQTQIAQLRQACSNAITGGLPVTVSSGAYTLANTPTDQVNALMASQTAQGILAKAQAWAASTDYPANSFCSVGGVILWTASGGTSGTTEPTAPTDFGLPVTDGTVTWERMGMLAGLASGGTIYLTPQDIISAFEQGVAYVEAQRITYRTLKAQVLAATTVAEVQAILWP